MKVILALVVVAVVAGFGVSWAKEKADSVIHHAIDTGLPAKLEAKTWAPLDHGKRMRADRVRFDRGRLVTVRCHETLAATRSTSTTPSRSRGRPRGSRPTARVGRCERRWRTRPVSTSTHTTTARS